MKHITNVRNPSLPDAYEQFEEFRGSYMTKQEQWNYHLAWVQSHVIGEPVQMGTYDVAKLKSLGYIGIYDKETT